jgi:hypothetical protein
MDTDPDASLGCDVTTIERVRIEKLFRSTNQGRGAAASPRTCRWTGEASWIPSRPGPVRGMHWFTNSVGRLGHDYVGFADLCSGSDVAGCGQEDAR